MFDDYNNDFYLQQQMNHDDVDPDQALKSGCFVSVFYLCAIIVAFLLCALFGSCKSVEYVTVPQTHTDTLIVTNHQRDSIYLHDSTYVEVKGDTFRIVKWRTKYVEKLVRDTIYKSRVDSIPYPVPQPVEVPAKLTWWQQFRLHLANILIYVLLGIGGYYLLKYALKRFLP